MGKLGQKAVLKTIKVAKKFFYNTPIHRMKVTNAIYKKLFFSAVGDSEVVEVFFKGAVFKISSRDFTILPSMMNGDYEDYVLGLYKKLVKPGSVIVDVGANIGLFSVLGSKYAGDKGMVYAFEPEPNNLKLFNENLKANNCKNVKVVNKAAGEKKGELSLYIAKNSVGTHSLIKKDNHELDGEIKVEVTTLDTRLNKLKQIDVLKVDVEGFEPVVFRGAKKTLERTSVLFFEYNQADTRACSSIEELLELLSGFKYIYGLNERTRTLRRFSASDFNDTNYTNLIASKRPLPKSISGIK